VKITPEEAVRQSFVHLLIANGYPQNMIKTEFEITSGQRQKRPDIAVFKNTGEVFMIVECKAPHIKLSQNTISQILAYNNTLDAEYLVITNGNNTFAFKREGENFERISKLPDYSPM